MRSKLKKSLAMLLAVVMAFAGIGQMQKVKAADAKIGVTVKVSTDTVQPGDTVHVQYWMNPGQNVIALIGNVEWDPEVYDYVEGSLNKKTDAIWDAELPMILEPEEGEHSVSVMVTYAKPYTKGGLICEFDVVVKENAAPDSEEGNGFIGFEFRGGEIGENANDTIVIPSGRENGDVTVEDANGNVIENGDITVTIPLKSIALNKTEPFTLEKGTADDLSVIATPEAALAGKTIEWTTSNNKAVTVDKNGHIEAVGIGEAVITAKVDDKTASVKVTVNAPLKSISLNKSTLALRKGAAETLTVSYNPVDTTDSKAVTWTSGDATVASVDANGKVTALKDGTTTITAKVGDKTATCEVTVKEEPLTGIELDQTSMTIARGTNSETLNVLYSPEDTTDDKTVAWSSKDKTIATVKDGVVTGKGIGTTTITATVGKFTAECEVTVNAPLTSISLSAAEETILKNKSETIKVSFNPEDTTDAKEVTWSIDNTDVAEMTVDGTSVTVKGLKKGTATVTATSTVNAELKATCKITVEEIPLEGITMSDDSITLEAGETHALSVEYNTENTTDDKTVTWESTNTKVATVDENGLVTAVSGGTAKIIAKAANGVTAECDVKVLIHTTGITVEPGEIEILMGQKTTEPLKVSFDPDNTDDVKDIKWSSSDKSIAKVDAEGYVTGVKEGTAIITATTADGKFSASCEVTVVEIHLEGILLADGTPEEMLKGQKHTLEVLLNPENTTDVVELTFASSDESVAVVSEEGVVEALKEGTATITVTATDGKNSWEVSYELTVTEIPLEGIDFKEKIETLEEGQTAQLELVFSPENTTDDKIIVWSSSNTDVATVKNGLLTAVKAGKTTITVKVGSMEISYELTVTEKKVPDTDDKGNSGNNGENNKPGQGNVPQTGDASNGFSVMMTMILSLAAALVLVFAKKRVHR